MWPMVLLRVGLVASIGVIGTGSMPAQETPKHLEADLIAQASRNGDWTVITTAPDGALGVATAATAGQAIAQAIRNCRAVSREKMGCGAKSRAVRAGWIVAFRCGATNIIAAGPSLADAERTAAEREAELRRRYVLHLPSCRRALTLDPQGGIAMMGS